MRTASRISRISVTLLLFAIFVATACSSSSSELAATKTSVADFKTAPPTIAQTVAPSPKFIPIAGGVAIPESIAPQLDAIQDAVALIRGYKPDGIVDRQLLSREKLQDHLAVEFASAEVREAIEIDDRLFKLLGMVDGDLDLTGEYEILYGTQVVGLYQSETDQLFVVEDDETSELSLLEEVTYSHEYYHLVQDDRFDLDQLQQNVEGNRDAELALVALIEGDATSLQTQYLLENVSVNRILASIDTLTETLSDIPDAPLPLQRSLEFPYLEGAEFVDRLSDSQLLNSYVTLPASTEQILHPEKYLAGEIPIDVQLPDLAGFPGEGWSLFHKNVLGEFMIALWLESLGSADAEIAAAGWAGDRFALLDGPAGERAFAAIIEWDDPLEDAAQFAGTLAAALDRSDEYVLLANDETTFGWQSDQGTTLLQLHAGGRICVVVAPDLESGEKLLLALADQT